MNLVKIVFLWALLSLVGCGGESSSSPSDIDSTSKSYQGVAQKGPLAVGSDVHISILDASGVATGDVITTKVLNKKGTFKYKIPNGLFKDDFFLEITSNGLFFDEAKGQQTTQSVQLKAITNNPENSSVNLLTHWATQRIKSLKAAGDNNKSAFEQANNELKALLGTGLPNQLDFTEPTRQQQESALLLLLSGALLDVANEDSQDINVIIQQISSDFSEDGKLGSVGNTLFKRMQANVRDNPKRHTDVYAKKLNQEIEGDVVSGKNLPSDVLLASRPVASAPPVIFAEPGETIVLDGSASHDSGGIINFTWFRIDQQTQFDVPLSDRFDSSPRITVPNQEPLELLFALIVTDSAKSTDTTVVKVIVRKVLSENGQPVADSQTVMTNEDTPIDIILTGSDPDDGLISFVINTPALLPHGLLQGEPPNLKYTPTANYFGSDSFTFHVNDGSEDSNTAMVNIIIKPVNDPPIADAGFNQFVGEKEEVILNGNSSFDVDGTIVSFLWTQSSGIAVSLDDVSSPTPSFVAPDDIGLTPQVLTFDLLVVDNDGLPSTLDTVTVTVQPLNNIAPNADAGDDQVVSLSSSGSSGSGFVQVKLDGTGSSDPDGDDSSLSYLWTVVSEPLLSDITITASDSSEPSFSATEYGNYTIRLTVTDSDVLTDTDEVEIVIQAPPTAEDITKEINIFKPIGIILLGDDPDGINANLVYTIISGPTDGDLVVTGSDTVEYTPFSATTSASPTADSFTYQVTDEDTLTSRIATVNLELPVVIPVEAIISGAPSTVNLVYDGGEGFIAFFLLNGSASTGPIGVPLTYSWTVTPVVGGMNLDNTTTTTTDILSVSSFVTGIFTFTLTVSDGTGTPSGTDSTSVTVQVLPPT